MDGDGGAARVRCWRSIWRMSVGANHHGCFWSSGLHLAEGGGVAERRGLLRRTNWCYSWVRGSCLLLSWSTVKALFRCFGRPFTRP